MAVVMIVDDTDSARDAVARLLRMDGHRPLTAAGGRQAIDALEGEVPDLVLLDICMPDIDGLTVLQALRQHPHWQKLPVIMLSALSDAETIDRAKRLGASDYLIKSRFDWQDIRRRIERHLPDAPLSH